MPRPKARVVSGLKGKGFVEIPGDHIVLIYHTKDGKKTNVRTKASHTPKMKDIPDNILSQMAKQCKLKNGHFLDLVDCPMSRDEYEASLQEGGHI
jgi:hypothetical protein